jgi:hypothetical protein
MKLYPKLRFTLTINFLILCIGCSSDDTLQEENREGVAITIIGEDLNAVYQYDYDSASDIGIQTNLSTELGISNNYLTLRQLNNTLSFFTYANNAISLFQKDLASGGIKTFPEFYGITDERSLIWGLNNETSVYFGLYKPFGSTNLALRIVDLGNFQGFDVSLEFGIEQLFEPLYSDGRLYITYRSGIGEYKIVVYDTDKDIISKTFEFGAVPPSILITDLGDVAIFTRGENKNTLLELFDSSNLIRIKKMELELEQSLATGPINAYLEGDKLYYQYAYTQPFQIVNGPAILDITTGNNTILNVLGIINDLNEQNGFSIQPVIGQYLYSQNLFAISYAQLNEDEAALGGFILVGLDGNLLVHKSLNFVPTYFVE